MTLTSYVLEDEQLAAKRLIRLLNEIAPDLKVLHIFETIEDLARKLMEEDQPEILFLDIQVADGNSMELFKVVEVNSKVIFTTAYDEYAIEAFRKNATDYLLKPIKKEQLVQAIGKARPLKSLSEPEGRGEYRNRFLIKFGVKLNSIKTADIAYVYSKNKISYFVTFSGERFPSDFKLHELEDLLDPTLFSRANRQFIVHIDSIASMTRHDASRLKLSLNPSIDEEIVVSTEKSKIFKDWLKR